MRLLQVAYHNRSMSLYAKLGFDVQEPFAAMQGDPLALQIPGYEVRAASAADLDACNALCVRVHGHDRGGELRDSLAEGAAQVGNAAADHRVYDGDRLFRALSGRDQRRSARPDRCGRGVSGPGFLVPMRNTELLRWCLAQGLRVFYVMNLMTIGLYSEPRGAFLASVSY